MTQSDIEALLARYDDYRAKYQNMVDNNADTLARLNLVAWAGETLTHQLARALRQVAGLEKEEQHEQEQG